MFLDNIVLFLFKFMICLLRGIGLPVSLILLIFKLPEFDFLIFLLFFWNVEILLRDKLFWWPWNCSLCTLFIFYLLIIIKYSRKGFK